jgi:hypothetical protein
MTAKVSINSIVFAKYLNLHREFYSILKLGCGQEDDHKKMFLVLGWMPSEVCEIFDVKGHNAWTKKANMKKLH